MAQIAVLISEEFRPALITLLHASDYAHECNADRWQFAVELTQLLASGATLTDIRWLIHRGLAEHAKETTIPGESKRSYRPLAVTSFPPDTCVVLSPAGAAEIQAALGMAVAPARWTEGRFGATASAPFDAREVARVTPHWDPGRRELRYQGQTIKRYRVPAKNQALVLAAFEELGWPEFIDDPLPQKNDLDPKHRLQATIKSLNRNQLVRLIRFHGNGNGIQVFWEALPEAGETPLRSGRSQRGSGAGVGAIRIQTSSKSSPD